MAKKRKLSENISDAFDISIYDDDKSWKEKMNIMIEQLKIKSQSDDQDLSDFFEKSEYADQKTWEELVNDMLYDLQDRIDTYLNFENIIENIKDMIKNKKYKDSEKMINDMIETIEDNQEEAINRCLECGEDMGRTNPRQLCRKTYCENL